MSTSVVFVYGTLRSDAGHEMHAVLTAHAVLLGPATVHGDLYALREFVALAPREAASSVVTGELYEIRSDAVDRLLRILDDYEGLSDPSQPHDYRRDVVTAALTDGRTLRAWAYVLNRSADGLRRIPSGDYKDSAPK
jgi:gamma-glutamylcyclotransferase (GGCT)/AIG2-like uncharacterized protein YtfP